MPGNEIKKVKLTKKDVEEAIDRVAEAGHGEVIIKIADEVIVNLSYTAQKAFNIIKK